jgi:ATP/maltotriose-dependent transcriptional regulator MalT
MTEELAVKANRFVKKGLTGYDACYAALALGDFVEAGQIIIRHRWEITAGEQWHRLDGWFDLPPAKVVENSPELLMLKAWSCDNRDHFDESVRLLDLTEAILDGPQAGGDDYQNLRGEVHDIAQPLALQGRRGSTGADAC